MTRVAWGNIIFTLSRNQWQKSLQTAANHPVEALRDGRWVGGMASLHILPTRCIIWGNYFNLAGTRDGDVASDNRHQVCSPTTLTYRQAIFYFFFRLAPTLTNSPFHFRLLTNLDSFQSLLSPWKNYPMPPSRHVFPLTNLSFFSPPEHARLCPITS